VKFKNRKSINLFDVGFFVALLNDYVQLTRICFSN